MDVKDLKVDEVKGIAIHRLGNNKRLQYFNWTTYLAAIFLLLLIASLVFTGTSTYVKDGYYKNANGDLITYNIKADVIIVDGVGYYYDSSKTVDLNNNTVFVWLSRISCFVIIGCILKWTWYDKPKYKKKFLQYWKDNGKLPEDKEIGY